MACQSAQHSPNYAGSHDLLALSHQYHYLFPKNKKQKVNQLKWKFMALICFLFTHKQIFFFIMITLCEENHNSVFRFKDNYMCHVEYPECTQLHHSATLISCGNCTGRRWVWGHNCIWTLNCKYGMAPVSRDVKMEYLSKISKLEFFRFVAPLQEAHFPKELSRNHLCVK